MDRKLIVITGPTGSGKTAAALSMAERLGCDIISADSRQIYKGIPIGTAAPSAEELARVCHHFVGVLGLDEPYSAAQYEADVMRLLPRLWRKNPVQVMCGGSMMYVDAVCRGIDDLPEISDAVRRQVMSVYDSGGLEALQAYLQIVDPGGYSKVDLLNPRRVAHAIEISLQAGRPASELLTGRKKERPFDIEMYYIDLPREELFARINARVDAMVEQGLEQEARSVFHLRRLNSLNTVGYKEMFAYFDGAMTRDEAIARIAKNTRVYAKKQLTWLKKRPEAVPLPQPRVTGC